MKNLFILEKISVDYTNQCHECNQNEHVKVVEYFDDIGKSLQRFDSIKVFAGAIMEQQLTADDEPICLGYEDYRVSLISNGCTKTQLITTAKDD